MRPWSFSQVELDVKKSHIFGVEIYEIVQFGADPDNNLKEKILNPYYIEGRTDNFYGKNIFYSCYQIIFCFYFSITRDA